MNELLALFAVAALMLLLWPRRGLLWLWLNSRHLAARARREDALKHIHKAEVNGRTPSVNSVAGALRIPQNSAAALLGELERLGLLSFKGGRPRLSESGRELARHVIRSHRLWESFLADHTGTDESEWHRQAERQEHLLTPGETDALAARLGHPLRDPHGDRIPGVDEEVAADAGQPLTEVSPGDAVQIAHLEDEPESLYSTLVALGLKPGMRAVVQDRDADGIRLRADGREISLTTLLANNVSVIPLGAAGDFHRDEHYLAELAPGVRARVLGLVPACRGAERRRLLDLGFVAGTEIEVEFVSPNGDPTAYRVRGAIVALRREQASHIRISQEAAA